MKDLVRSSLKRSLPPTDVVREAADRLRPLFPVDEWISKRPMRAAAVLVPIVDRPTGLTVLLTKRNDALPEHPGQFAFPGGSVEPGDSDAIGTALRETFEEIGLTPNLIEIVGFLTPHMTLTGYAVTPVVGLVNSGFVLVLDYREVSEVFEIPITFFLDPASTESEDREIAGRRVRLPVFRYEGRRIWGATAFMLADLQERLVREAA